MADKDKILNKVRTALGRDAKSSVPASPGPRLQPPEAARDPAALERLVERFAEEVVKLGAKVEVVRSASDIHGYLSMLIDANSVNVAAVSDCEIARSLALAEWVKSRRLSLVPTLKQFAAGESNGDTPPMERYKWELIKAGIGITSADYAIADTGSMVLVTGGEQHRLISLLPPVHVCLLNRDRLVPDLATFLAKVRSDHYSAGAPPQAVTFITGTSRTADIELQLTRGVHGPREVHVLLYSESELKNA
ncbi:MAG TPA: lactate utilization protein [Blastocatellia bacterium]|nr:lactate utilization protein [Blastocatellia bacterium]